MDAIKKKLAEAKIQLEGGKIRRSDLVKAARILADYDESDVQEFVNNMAEDDDETSFSDILDAAGIDESGLFMLNAHMNHGSAKEATSLEEVKQALEDAKNDIEEYVLPAIETCLEFIATASITEAEESENEDSE